MSATRRCSASTAAGSKKSCDAGSKLNPAPGSASRRPPCGAALEPAERVETLLEAPSVGLLGAGERLEPLGDLGEAFLASHLRETRVHLRVLVGFAFHGRLEVQVGGTQREA